MLNVEVSHFLACFGHISIKFMPKKLNASVASETNFEKISVLGIQNHRSAAVFWGGGGAPPWIR